MTDAELPLQFTVHATQGQARRGQIRFARGVVDTPAFMPVGTAGSVKGMTPSELVSCGAQIILSNTYHLHLRPGHELIADLGGLHEFMQWAGPILTDSGGYQVFSMVGLNRVDEEGVTFRSYLDGSPRRLTPEKSMEIQAALGSDVAMALDICPALPASHEELSEAVARTTRSTRGSGTRAVRVPTRWCSSCTAITTRATSPIRATTTSASCSRVVDTSSPRST